MSVPPSPAFWVATIAYAAATTALLIALGGKQKARPIATALVAFALVAHGADIGWRGTEHVHPAQSVREALGFLAFILTGGYLVATTRYRLTLGGVVVMPISLILLVLARVTPAGEPGDFSQLGRVHIMLVTVGTAVFALAAALSAIYLAEDRAMKKKKFDALAFRDKGAPIDALDRTAHRLIWVGFPIFTTALVLGAMWARTLDTGLDRPEYALAVVTWGAYATLLVMRQIYGWRGRRAARLTLAGFAAAVVVLLIYLLRRMTG